jgi:MFS family permease
VYRTTGSGFLLGLVTFCSQIPMLIFLPLAGLLSDRYGRRKLMIAAYVLAAAQAATLGLLALSGTLRIWQILLLGFVYGVIMAFETPARQSLISQMVNSRDDLPNAIALISFTASSYTVLMPIFARDVFRGDAHTLGFLVGSAGLGAVIGTLFLTTRPNVFELSRLVPFTSAAAGIALVLVGISNLYSNLYWLSLVFMACLGFGIIVTAASVNMMLQTIVDEDKRGCIVSFYAMAFLGMAPVGGLIAGSLAGQLVAPLTAAIEGACCLLGALALMRSLPAIQADLHRARSRLTEKP